MHEVLAAKNFDRDTLVLTPAYCERSGWTLLQRAFPILDVVVAAKRDIRMRFGCDDWNELPPSVELLTSEGAQWGPLPGGVFNSGPHPTTNKGFVCMRGVREYHTHPSHLSESWASYRGQDGMNLVGILTQLTRAWRKAYPT